MLELVDITYKIDDKTILNNISLKIDPGFTVITGPNGAGKSTLAKIIMGIVKPTSGKILLNGEDISDLSIDERAKKGISFSFQSPVKFKGITVADLITLSSFESESFVSPLEALQEVGLCPKDYLNREIDSSLSGGELKRIEIASTIVRNSKVMVFDEPEAGIDLWSFSSLIDVFKNIRKKNNSASIIISHQEKIIDIADTIILLSEGNATKVKSKKELGTLVSACSSCKGGC